MGIGGVACPKPEKIARVKGRKDRAEAKVKKSVRAQCVERDGFCRYGKLEHVAPCQGSSQWAHMGKKRRAKTRGMAPTIRHTTADSLMLCQRHHDEYDNRRKPRLWIRELTEDGANGSLQFITDGV